MNGVLKDIRQFVWFWFYYSLRLTTQSNSLASNRFGFCLYGLTTLNRKPLYNKYVLFSYLLPTILKPSPCPGTLFKSNVRYSKASSKENNFD